MADYSKQNMDAKKFPSLSPYLARFGNVLYGYDVVCAFDFFGHQAEISPLFDKQTENCTVLLTLRVGASLWKIALEKQDILLFHPSIVNAQKIQHSLADFFPEPVRQALLESSISPFIAILSQKLGNAIYLENCVFIQDTDWLQDFSSCLAFSLRVEREEAPHINTFYVVVPEEKQSIDILEQLFMVLKCSELHAEQEKSRTDRYNNVSVPLSFCIGQTSLQVQDIKALSQGDVILFDEYFAKNSRMRVYPYLYEQKGNSLHLVGNEFMLCSVQGMDVCVIGWNSISSRENENNAEDSMQDNLEQDIMAVKSDEDNVRSDERGMLKESMQANINELAVTLHFELDRRVVTLQELQEIKAGYTFVLDTDIHAPVALTVNGKRIGQGRIVEINSMLGVQVTKIEQ